MSSNKSILDVFKKLLRHKEARFHTSSDYTSLSKNGLFGDLASLDHANRILYVAGYPKCMLSDGEFATLMAYVRDRNRDQKAQEEKERAAIVKELINTPAKKK